MRSGAFVRCKIVPRHTERHVARFATARNLRAKSGAPLLINDIQRLTARRKARYV
jgi:hypothetical protein